MALNPKQERFVAEYLMDLNATQAAIRAGYSARTAYAQGCRLLTHAEIGPAIAAAMANRGERTKITIDRVLTELGRIGLSDLRNAFTSDGKLKSVAAFGDEFAPAVSSVKVVTRKEPGGGEDAEVEYVTEIKLWDKLGAIDKLGKHLGAWREQLDVNVTGDLAAMMAERRARVAARRANGDDA